MHITDTEWLLWRAKICKSPKTDLSLPPWILLLPWKNTFWSVGTLTRYVMSSVIIFYRNVSKRFSCFLAEKNQNDINTFYAYRSFFYLIFKPSKINSHNSPISKLYLKYLSCRSFKLFKKFARNFFEPMKIFFFILFFACCFLHCIFF